MKQEKSAVFRVLVPRYRTTCGKKKRHFDELAKLDKRRTALPNHGVQLREWHGNIAANSTVHGNEHYRSKVFRYFRSVLSSVPEHDIISQVIALHKANP